MDDLLPLVEALWAGESREERLTALELPQHYPFVISQLTWEHFDRWRGDLDNWELTDVLGVGVLGPWVAASTERREQHLWDLVQDRDIWSRRLGLVSIVGVNRARADIDLTPSLWASSTGSRSSPIVPQPGLSRGSCGSWARSTRER